MKTTFLISGITDMSYRYMRVLVFFDLPSVTTSEKREYRKFRTFLVKSGFLMLQESVYCKLALNTTVANSIVGKVKRNKPKEGIVQLLTITEKQFSKMEFVVGEKKTDFVDSDERLGVL
jgi:CRISPR-associated protein Cas2